MKKFDYSFLDNGLLPANLINITGFIYSLKTGSEMRKDEYEKIFTEMEIIAKIQSVKSSNAIEGIVTSDECIREIVNQNSKPLNHNELEIAGYRDALNEIHLNYESLRLSSIDWDKNEQDYIPFIENFLSTLYLCYKELDKRFSVVNSKKITKKARVEATVLNSLTPLSKADICKILPDVSPTTVEAVLGAMVKRGAIQTIGNGRNTKYVKR